MRLLVPNQFYVGHVCIWLTKVHPIKEKDHILDIHLALAPQIHVYVTQPILLSLSPLLLAAPAPQIIGAAPGIPVSAGLPKHSPAPT